VQLKNLDEKAMMDEPAMQRAGMKLGSTNDHAEAKIA
jgi:hypothetical protein